MQYLEFKPRSELSPYIDYYWSLEVEGYRVLNLKDLRLPDYSPEWIFDVSDPAGSRITLWFKESDILVHEQPVEIFGIRFRPYGLAKIGNVNMRDFRGSSHSITPALIFPELTNRLEEVIFLDCAPTPKIKLVEDLLEDKISKSVVIDNITKRAVEDIAQTRGNITISGLCEVYNLSKTALNNKLVDTIGMSPKKLARIHRFHSFLREGVRRNERTFATLAQDSGYYDQSHLNHEFKSFTGYTPAQFFNNSSEIIVRSCNFPSQ